MNVEFDGRRVSKLFDRMKHFTQIFPESLEQYRQKSTERLLELVIQHASGRPGPNVVTGAYISRFMIVEDKVVNPSLQTHRLEYGFTGTDSLGRQYNQPPFPHFRPALQEMREEYLRGIVPLVRQTWKDS